MKDLPGAAAIPALALMAERPRRLDFRAIALTRHRPRPPPPPPPLIDDRLDLPDLRRRSAELDSTRVARPHNGSRRASSTLPHGASCSRATSSFHHWHADRLGAPTPSVSRRSSANRRASRHRTWSVRHGPILRDGSEEPRRGGDEGLSRVTVSESESLPLLRSWSQPAPRWPPSVARPLRDRNASWDGAPERPSFPTGASAPFTVELAARAPSTRRWTVPRPLFRANVRAPAGAKGAALVARKTGGPPARFRAPP